METDKSPADWPLAFALHPLVLQHGRVVHCCCNSLLCSLRVVLYLSARMHYVFVFVFDRVKCTLRVHARAKFHQLKLQEEQLVRERASVACFCCCDGERREERRGKSGEQGGDVRRETRTRYSFFFPLFLLLLLLLRLELPGMCRCCC